MSEQLTLIEEAFGLTVVEGENLQLTLDGGSGDAVTSSSLEQFTDVTQATGAVVAFPASGTHSGTNTGDNAANILYSGLVSNATHTGDVTGATTLTLATVNANVGSFGSATAASTFTVNAKGLLTAAGSVTITPAIGSITGLGANVMLALQEAVGTDSGLVVVNGALGAPASGNLVNCTFPTLNQSTTGSAATLTTARTINGVSFNGSANITVTAAGSTLSDTVTVANGGTGATTADTARSALGLGTDDRPTFANATFATGTITASQPLALTQTWNNAAVTFTGLQVNVTDTASNAASLLMDLQADGLSKFRVKTQPAAGPNSDGFLWEANTSGGVFSINGSGNTVNLGQSGNHDIALANGQVSVFRSGGIRIGTSTALSPRLYADADSTLAQRNGTNAQESRIYGTYTDTSNYRRLALKMSTSGVATVAAEGLGTGASSNSLQFQTDGMTRLSIAAHAFTNSGLVITSTDNSSTIVGFGSGTGANITRIGSGGFRFSDSSGSGAMIISNRDIQISGGNFRLLFTPPNDGSASLATSTGGGGPTRHNIHNIGALAHTTLRVQGGASVGRGYFDTPPPTDGMLVQGNVGIGTTDPVSKLTVSNGDIETSSIGTGIIMKSPDGSRWRVTVANGGALVTTGLTPP